jgi:hypothetical protein
MGEEHQAVAAAAAPWRLNVSDFQIPERPKDKEPPFSTAVFHRGQGTYMSSPPLHYHHLRLPALLTSRVCASALTACT